MTWWITDTSIGQRLKFIRRFRRLTQKELGLLMGYSEKTADVRIAQYEKNARTPNAETTAKLAEVLKVSPAVFSPTICASREDLLQSMYWLFLMKGGGDIYELAAYLTVKFEDYTRDEVQATLQWLFEQQYELTLTEVVEIRTRTTSSTDPETGETTTEEEDYEYYILNVKLRNKGLNSVISNSGLSEDDMERYRILLQTRGNRPDIFGNDIYATPGGEYTDYDIPGEALTDTRFANMIREAEKYLGYPYVWGGSSPSTSFDCSGFVSYVINHCGNGWSVGRLTANGLMGVCDIIPKSSAKPGDLIFFQGTYDTSGASHVGIYVGNGMMIHCGNPISYASIESNYWQQHFYCFGRIRN